MARIILFWCFEKIYFWTEWWYFKWNSAIIQDWGCGGQECNFQLNPRVIGQISASHECTVSQCQTFFMNCHVVLIQHKVRIQIKKHRGINSTLNLFLFSDFFIMILDGSKSAKACFILRKAYWMRGRAMFCVSCAWVARGRGTLLGAGLGASSSTTRIKVAGAPPTRGSNTPPDRIPHLSSRYTSSRAFKPLYSRNLTLLLLFNKICEICWFCST